MKPQRFALLPPLVFCVNLIALGLFIAYSLLNLRPDIPGGPNAPHLFIVWVFLLAVAAPAVASAIHVRPVLRWLRLIATPSSAIPPGIAQRAVNAPMALALFSLAGWLLVIAPTLVRLATREADIPVLIAAHHVLRSFLLGLIVATATFFATEYVCRMHVWPALLVGTHIDGNPRLHRVRVWHRLLALWLAISALPLGVVAATSYLPVAGLDLTADPLTERIVSVVFLVALSAGAGGAWLAWLVSRSIALPLESLERAIARVRDGHFDVHEPVNATDEIGALTEGFNLMTQRLAVSYSELEARNRELAQALDRVIFLEHVKRGLDRFVPETVRRAIEVDPDNPRLAKETKDVTVLFLDIEGYTRLSEQLSRATLNALVERYFSLFLEEIRAQGGDINETAGDGLMIIFHGADPQAHAAAAARAALAIQRETAAANLAATPSHPSLQINIGISSGECDVGATRFEGPGGERWTFTASGPVTNLAARLGDYADGGQILVAPETARRLQGRFSLRSLGECALKNMSQSVKVWELQVSAQVAPTISMGKPNEPEAT